MQSAHDWASLRANRYIGGLTAYILPAGEPSSQVLFWSLASEEVILNLLRAKCLPVCTA